MFRRRSRAGSAGSQRLVDKFHKKKRSFLKRNNMEEIATPRHGDDPHACEQERPKKKEEEPYMGRYKTVAHLGKGSYGSVVEAKSLWDNGFSVSKGQHVAIKNVHRIFNNEVEAKRLLRELHILNTLQGHDCIVSLLDLIPPSDALGFKTLSLVFNCAHTDLKKILRSTQKFTSLHVEYIVYQILLGTLYMHSAGIAHRDLKPANILINADCTIRICDFGLARGINEEVEQINAKKDDKKEEGAKDVKKSEADEKRKLSSRKNAFKKKRMRREVTKHVVTRWYRSPEVILIQQKKGKLRAIDLWSIGCIFAELLQMQGRYCKSHKDRTVLFPGRSCFPLSADDPFAFKDRTDQLNLIFDLIGTPTKDEILKLDEGKARKYLLSLKPKKGIPMTWKFPALPTGAINIKEYLEKHERVSQAMDLLEKLLKFDVDKRITAKEALGHPYCSRVRAQELESQLEPVQFEFEDKLLTKYKIRQMICDQVVKFNPTWVNITRKS